MTNPKSTIPEQVNQAQVVIEEKEKVTPNGVYAGTKHSNNNLPTEWLNIKQTSCADTTENPTNFSRNMNNKRNENSDEYTRQLNYLNMQNNVYFKAGYPDTRAATYYGWLPGLSPMRFPALIYPHSFLGFAPTVAWMKRNDNNPAQATAIEKIDRWQQKNRNNTSNSEGSNAEHDSSVYREKKTKDTAAANNSEDEGLVLDEREMLKRHRQKDVEKLQTQAMTLPQPERSSVIHENISIQAKPSVITHSQDATKTPEMEQNKPAKRGRASTRQIEKTEQYWDRRKKNNVSAKKSRDARRQREALTNQRSSMLETENLRLRAELATLRDENSRLKQELSNAKNTQRLEVNSV